MFSSFPKTALDVLDWPWEKYAAYAEDLNGRKLTAKTLKAFMDDWSRLSLLIQEAYARLYVATTLDTADEAAQKRYSDYLDSVYPAWMAADQQLKEKLLKSKLEPEGFEVQLRNLRTEAALFREANLSLLTEEKKLSNEYDQIVGAQTVMWEGKEVTLPQLQPVYQDTDRGKREQAWRLAQARWQEDRGKINELWKRFIDLRGKLAANADLPTYREYRYQQMLRLDYTAEDCKRFHAAIEKAVVPAAERIYEKRRKQLGVDKLRPWDLEVDALGRAPLRPFKDDSEFQSKASAVFHKVDAELASHFDLMRREKLLDLENRKGKAPGGYEIDYAYAKRAFIFMNAVGIHDDLQTLLHEAGHAFHTFETMNLPYAQQLQYGAEIAEVASMSMELLSAPYLSDGKDGFYSPADAARARIEHLEGSLLFWPYMAVVDAFQHWVYENHAAASDPAKCDAKWDELWGRFMKAVDWSGLETERMTGWHRKLHIHQVPFYYVDYGLAQLGAAQVWMNARNDQAKAVKDYRYALSLGATKTLPELYAAAGAKLAFDADTLGKAVDLMMGTIEELEKVK